MNIQKCSSEAQRMQSKLAEKQAELSQKTIEASAGGGKVMVTASGAGDVLSIKIDPIGGRSERRGNARRPRPCGREAGNRRRTQDGRG